MIGEWLDIGRVDEIPLRGSRTVQVAGGDDIAVDAGRVVTTHVEIVVPSMRGPSYVVAPGVECIPPNDLPRIREARDRYVIVGAGKTGMDACVWLLRHGVSPERLTWIKPRDSWILDRAAVQPGSQFAKRVLRDFSADQRRELDFLVDRCADAVEQLLTQGLAATQNQMH